MNLDDAYRTLCAQIIAECERVGGFDELRAENERLKQERDEALARYAQLALAYQGVISDSLPMAADER